PSVWSVVTGVAPSASLTSRRVAFRNRLPPTDHFEASESPPARQSAAAAQRPPLPLLHAPLAHTAGGVARFEAALVAPDAAPANAAVPMSPSTRCLILPSSLRRRS